MKLCLLWQDHPEKEVKAGVSLSSYWPYFRELDMEVLKVLQCGLLSRSVLDTKLHSKVKKTSTLSDSVYRNVTKQYFTNNIVKVKGVRYNIKCWLLLCAGERGGTAGSCWVGVSAGGHVEKTGFQSDCSSSQESPVSQSKQTHTYLQYVNKNFVNHKLERYATIPIILTHT